MTISAGTEAGKTDRDENFPVASFLLAPRLRAPILSFYRFARAADDIADHAALSERDKFAGLDFLERTLLGKSDKAKAALPLRSVLAEHRLAPTHPLDLLTAFRADVSKRRYADWDELMHYCRYSANPVGRFVLDLHREDRSVWSYSDSLCSALQVINHLQDCAKDYRELDRVYLPLDVMERFGARVEELGAPKCSPALRACLKSIADKTTGLLPDASRLPLAVKDTRLGLETGAIVKLAQRLAALLIARDPLSEHVHLSKLAGLKNGIQGAAGTFAARLTRRSDFTRPSQKQ